MSLQFKQLLDDLHRVFNKNPMPAPAFRLFFNLPNLKAFASIINHTLKVSFQEQNLPTSPFDTVYRDRELSVSIDSGARISTIYALQDLSLDLRAYTMERLAEFLNGHGFQAAVILPRYKKMLAASLIDDVLNADLSSSKDFSISTNPLWVFLRPLAWAIEDHAASVDTALAQLNILTSQGYFADFWGRFLDIVRKPGEGDIMYTERIVRTILLKRDNNRALEQIVLDEFGVKVEVEDLWPTVLNINNSIIFSKIPGQVFNVGNFLVTGPIVGQALIDLVNRHKAAGTRAFFYEFLDTEINESVDSTTSFAEARYDISIFDMIFADSEFNITIDIGGDISEVENTVPEWAVELTPMPGSMIV